MRALALAALLLAGCADAQESEPPASRTVEQVAVTPPDETTPDASDTMRDTSVEGVEIPDATGSDHETALRDTLPSRKPVPVRVEGLAAANAHFGGEIELADPTCFGDAVQGGLVVCYIPRFSPYTVDGKSFRSGGEFGTTAFIGLDRDAGARQSFTYRPNFHGDIGPAITATFDVAPRDWDISRIDGLPKNMVSEYTEEELAHIRRSTARKKVGFASNAEEVGFADGFTSPIPTDYIKTTNFGAQRILNGEPKRPHFGVDMAAPEGTPIVAPADGIVSLADDDMYFEGSLVMIDHGQGLISYYLHMEDVLVEDGQQVARGEQIATVGSRGRSTGPHLCWRLKWHGRNLDPELLLDWPEEG